MTREEAIRGHRAMWSWLAEHPGETKKDYLREFDPEARLEAGCYVCEYVEEHYDYDCTYCPLEWPDRDCLGRGLFSQWCDAMDEGEHAYAAEIARQIAELPEKEEEQ